jgi:hypothetical protein
MGGLHSDQQRPGLRAGTRENNQQRELGEEGLLKVVFDRASAVCSFLYEGLGEVYLQEDLDMICSIRTVLDLRSRLEAVTSLGPVRAAQRQVEDFMKAAVHIDPEMLDQCDLYEWREQYQEFTRKLAEISQLPRSEKYSSMEVMVLMMNTEGKKYRGCEAVMGILTHAASIKSVESVVESWISVLEHHSNKSRNISAATIETEMTIAINGPALQHCDSIVQDSMRLYWRRMKNMKDGHFTRKSQNIKSYFVSKAVDRLRDEPVKNQLMV